MPTHISVRCAARAIVAAALVMSAGCDLNIANPNAATELGVLRSAAGIRAIGIGLQGRLGNMLEEGIYVPALLSGELGNTNATTSTTREFQHFPQTTANSLIEETNGDVLDLWSKNYQIVKSANDIIGNIDRVTIPGTRAGLLALAKLSKAIAFGTLIEAFEKIPIATTGANPPFVDRAAALTEALSLLASAKTDATGTPLSTDFTGSVLAPGFDLLNTIRAMQARYSLAAGNYADALAFANEVPAGVSSVIPFASGDRNPLTELFFGSSFFGALSTFRANAEAGDTRVAKFTTSATPVGFGGATLNGLNIYRAESDPIPLFTQDEMTLIRAEALARLDRLAEAIIQINIVRNANGLPSKTALQLATKQAVLDEIFRQRTYSLFISGLHLSDLRRFGLLALAKVAYLPYPFAERATNPNTPANPPQVP
ncbi:MAG: RagB/SusD family nutrient uptake outer membrane protein [Gemmatimonadaceae bacterium]